MNDLYIDGTWLDARSGASREIIDPLDQRVVRTVAEADADDARDAIAAARRAFDDGDWPHLPGAKPGLCTRNTSGSYSGATSSISTM